MAKLWKTHSISFVLIVLLGGLLIGAVLGSLLNQIFGLRFLNQDLFQIEISEFYVIKQFALVPTVASLLGLFAAGWFLFRKK